MLGYWRTHSEYQIWLISKLKSLISGHESQISFYADLIEKIYVLDLDPLKNIISPLYSGIGRPAKNQPEMFRALIAMVHCKTHNPTGFVAFLRANPVLAAICGF